MEYFFVPERLKALSWVELNGVCKSILGSQYTLVEKEQFFHLKTNADITFVENIFQKLGGFLKYGVFLDSDINFTQLCENEKVVFGISSYSSKYKMGEVKKLSKKLKDEFVALGRKVRFVLPQDDVFLSTSQILNNKLLENGFEMVLVNERMGKTLGIQDIEGFSLRDYSKPFVDSEMGVLPIKLCRMMINIAGIKQGECLWDPFCGTGNVLLEGLDLGYDVLGSDIDKKSLDGSKKNLQWAIKKFGYKNRAQVFFLDILNPTISKLDIVQNSNLGGIVCEPYMGKPQKRILDEHKAKSLVKQHYSLVQHLFESLEMLNLKKKIKVVVIFPEYRTKNGWVSIEKKLLNFKNTNLIEKDLHWSRENSIIKRLIFVFEYKAK